MRVVFTVNQVSPGCVGIGHFTFAGRRGLNRVRFAGRLHGRRLEPGTYRISARTANGRIVRRIRLVIVDGAAPSRAELQALRTANTCRDMTQAETSSATGSFPSSSAGEPPASRRVAQGPEASPGLAPLRGADLPSRGVLASAVEQTARAIQPVLVALLALAILLLAVASLPNVAVPDRRVNDMLARHRGEIAGLGAAALVAVALTFLLG